MIIESIEQVLGELPSGVGIALIVFFGILMILWILLPLWVLFIQWNTGKIKEEIRGLMELLEKKDWGDKDVNGTKN
jgi:hypothetical protein